MKSTELRPAFVWECQSCGHEQFERAVNPEFGDGELDELRSDFGIQPWETGKFHQTPKRVKCKKCNTIFDSEA